MDTSSCLVWEQVWMILEVIAVVCFTVELLLRTISAPSKVLFLQSISNWIDLIAIVPFYVENLAQQDSLGAFSVFRVVRLVRVFRVFKMGKSSEGIQLMGHPRRVVQDPQ